MEKAPKHSRGSFQRMSSIQFSEPYVGQFIKLLIKRFFAANFNYEETKMLQFHSQDLDGATQGMGSLSGRLNPRGVWIRPSLRLLAMAFVLSGMISSCWTAARVSAQDTQGGKPKAESTEGKTAFRGRLPAYYGRVVDETQRQEIYTIQGKYNEQIVELRSQIEKLEAQRDTEVEEVLTDEQRAQVKSMMEEARAKRRSTRGTQSDGANS